MVALNSNKLMYYHLKTRRCVYVKPLSIYCYLCIVIVLNDVTSKSREQRLITKEHIATQANLINLFKPALYSSTLVIELYKVEILTVTL